MHGVATYRHLSSVLFILLTVGHSRGDAPTVQRLSSNGTLTVSEGSDASFSCTGERPMDWRFPDRHESCFEPGKITSTSSRAGGVTNIRISSGKYFSTVKLTNVEWLDVGRVECYYRDQPELSDGFYLFVESQKHLLLPCIKPHWGSCSPRLYFPKTVASGMSVPISLQDEQEFAPCRQTDPEISKLDIFPKVPGRELNSVVDPTKGFQVSGDYQLEQKIVCRATNLATNYTELCYLTVKPPPDDRRCGVAITANVSAPAHLREANSYIFVSSNVTITCYAECTDTYPGVFQLNLTKASNVLASKSDGLVGTTRDGHQVYRVSMSSVLESVTADNANGVYECQFAFSRNSEIFEFSSYEYPVLVREPNALSWAVDNATTQFDNETGTAEGKFEMNCLADGMPPPRYTWYAGTTENILNNETDWHLLRDADSRGVYICHVSDFTGAPENSISLLKSPFCH